MKIGVLGTGDVGQVLGAGLAALGHDIMIGSRDPKSEKVTAWVERTGGKGGTFAEAAAFGEMVILATLWSGTEHALSLAGAENLAGKVVIDATNPLDFSAGFPPSLTHGHTDSGGEQVQRWIPDALVVKAFNIVGNAHMVNPDFPCGPPDMLICGNDDGAKQKVISLCAELGWPNTLDIGGIDGSRHLEPLCMLWVLYGARTGGWDHAVKFIRKSVSHPG